MCRFPLKIFSPAATTVAWGECLEEVGMGGGLVNAWALTKPRRHGKANQTKHSLEAYLIKLTYC